LATSLGEATNPESARHKCPAKIESILRDYLKHRLRTARLAFDEPPTLFPDGWETYTYRFRIRSNASLLQRFRVPLVLRVFSCQKGLARARHEFAVQHYLRQYDYPVAEPLILESACDFFGGPFLIRQEIPGRTLLSTLQEEPWKLWQEPMLMAQLQARLHSLPAPGFPRARGSLLYRSLEGIESAIRTLDLDGLKPGLDWLVAHRPDVRPRLAILHMDFHPMNLIYLEDGSLAVVDWTEADVGDPHADVATTLMLMATVPVGPNTVMGHISTRLGRGILLRRYLRAYRRAEEVDPCKLAYYRAWAAVRRLCQYSRWLYSTPATNGCRPSAAEHVSPQQLHTLEGYFRKWTGVVVRV
jgi:aminoglycoside phosphotransferase (APT) family kinase protein